MLRHFSFENVLSFKNKQYIDLIASNSIKSHKENLIYPLEKNKKEKLLKSLIVYGKNASGKSNLLSALYMCRKLILKSASGHKLSETGIVSYLLDKEKSKEPSKFSFEIIIDEVIYNYGFTCSDKTITEEWLVEYPNLIPKKIFSRNYTEKLEISFNKTSKISNSLRKMFGLVPDNKLLLGYINQDNLKNMESNETISKIKNIYNWFKDGLVFWNDDSEKPSIEFCKNKNSKKEMLLNILKKFDIQIEDIKIEEKDKDERTLFIQKELDDFLKRVIGENDASINLPDDTKITDYALTHVLDNNQGLVTLEKNVESSGTKKLFNLLGPLLTAIEENSLLIVDEIECNLHPHVLFELIRLFYALKKDSKAQFIFTTQYSGLLSQNLFRKDQIVIVDRKFNDSIVYTLRDVKNVPRTDSFEKYEKWYLDGRFGGIPFIEKKEN